jgi:hypothetical protein
MLSWVKYLASLFTRFEKKGTFWCGYAKEKVLLPYALRNVSEIKNYIADIITVIRLDVWKKIEYLYYIMFGSC